MSTHSSCYSLPDSMELESYEALSECLSMEMYMAEPESPSQFIEEPNGSSSTTFFPIGSISLYNISTFDGLVSESEEFFQYSDTVSLNCKAVDDCDWLNEIFQDITSPHENFHGETRSSPLESNCSWVDDTQFQLPLFQEAQMSSWTNWSITSANGVTEQSPSLPQGDILNVDDRSGLPHLMKAFGEAMADGSFALAEVITKRIREIVTPIGSAMERLAHYMFQVNQNDYIRQEPRKISKVATNGFYSLCLANRFAHFIGNFIILNSMPEGTETIHIIDFDIREGSQWPPLIEAAGSCKLVRLTSLRWSDSRFENTKKNLLEYAESRGLRLVVDEMNMDEIFLEEKRMKKRGGKEWLVFNCIVGVPCMGTQRRLSQAHDFLKLSKEIIGIANGGIITYGNGGAWEIGVQSDSGFASYFDECLLHSYALFESLEWHIPSRLVGARSAMESLFLAPSISSYAGLAKWEEIQEAYDGFPSLLQEHKLNKETVELAMEMVKGQGQYEVRGQGSNELILSWRGAPLVKFSSWR